MTFKPGFITPPWPHERGDSIRARSLIERIEIEAHHGCGLHYEIYEYRVLTRLFSTLQGLSAKDAETFSAAASSRGFRLDDSALQGSYQAYQKTLYEIRREQK